MKAQVTDVQVSSTVEIPLSKFKKFICRIFNIIPERKFNYLVLLEVSQPAFRINNIIEDEQGDMWRINGVDEKNRCIYYIQNIAPVSAFHFGTKVSLFGHSFSETMKP